jgi:hypothetical protein
MFIMFLASIQKITNLRFFLHVHYLRLSTPRVLSFFKNIFWGIFSAYDIQHCFICRPSDSTVPTDAGIEPRTVATGALAVRRSNH